MKKTIQLILSLTHIALSSACANATLSYWDNNGSTPGAGDTPNGSWDSNSFWSYDPAGSSATTAWTDGDTAVFSAGADATNAYTVTINGVVQAGGITFKDGAPTISGGTITITNEFDFPIVASTNATINSDLQDSSGTGGFRKTGPGRLTLGGAGSFYGGTSVISEGIVSVTSASALGSSLAPTVVSNGASLEVTNSIGLAEPVVLNGFGVSNRGALYGYIGTAGKLSPRTGGAVLDSDARINHYGTTGNWWYWSTKSIATNGLNNADVYFGGTGNSLRLDINNGSPCIDVGDGAIYKDGTVELRLEVGARARAVYFNQGHLLTRVGSGTDFCYRIVTPGNYAPAPIYVGAGAGQFRNGSGGPSQTWTHSIVLSAGANPVFRPYAGNFITLNGVISGSGGVAKYSDTGTLNLNATNTYAGTTTIGGGKLALGANGSIANSVVIDVQTNAVLDVSAVAGGFVLGAAQTLKGSGAVLGNVTANGIISPGASVGTLTFGNNLTLAGGLFVEVNRSVSPSNDLISVAGALNNTGTGTITVTNLGPSLAVGDSFQLFNQPVANGQALIVASAAGVVWTNNLAVDGSIAVVSILALPPATNLSIASSPGGIRLTASGAANSAYTVFTSTNLTAPLADWALIGVTNSDAGGLIQFLDAQGKNQQRFYRFAP